MSLFSGVGGFFSKIPGILGKFGSKTIGKAKPLGPTTNINPSLGKGNILPGDMPTAPDTKKSKAIEGIATAIQGLGDGFTSQTSTPPSVTPIQLNNTGVKIQSMPVDMPAIQPPVQQAPTVPVPTKTTNTDYNPLLELQKLIEKQRAGY